MIKQENGLVPKFHKDSPKVPKDCLSMQDYVRCHAVSSTPGKSLLLYINSHEMNIENTL